MQQILSKGKARSVEFGTSVTGITQRWLSLLQTLALDFEFIYLSPRLVTHQTGQSTLLFYLKGEEMNLCFKNIKSKMEFEFGLLY